MGEWKYICEHYLLVNNSEIHYVNKQTNKQNINLKDLYLYTHYFTKWQAFFSA